MIRGAVNAGSQPAVVLVVRGPAGAGFAVEFVVDTGFAGPLMLPPALAAALGLVPNDSGRVVLADGSAQQFDICPVQILWDGAWRAGEAAVMGTTPLLGMRLIGGHELRVAAVPGGAVEITALPPAPPVPSCYF